MTLFRALHRRWKRRFPSRHDFYVAGFARAQMLSEGKTLKPLRPAYKPAFDRHLRVQRWLWPEHYREA